MILTILEVPDEKLSIPTKEVSKDEIRSDDIKVLVQSMIDTCRIYGGVGLAANQVGIDKSIFIYKEPGLDRYLSAFNPEIIKKKGPMTSKSEGCLSIPMRTFNTKRYKKIVLKALDNEGRSFTIETKSKKAAVRIQHEVDHLNGITLLDRSK